jgi:hypothetical protein
VSDDHVDGRVDQIDSHGLVAGIFRGPWLGVGLIAVSVALWASFWGNLLEWAGPLVFVVLLGAGPLALVGIVLSIRTLVYKKRPRWVSIVGILMGLCAVVYIGLQFLQFLAAAAFA